MGSCDFVIRERLPRGLMIDHFEFKVFNLEGCIDFYSTVLMPLGIEKKWVDDTGAGFGLVSEENTRFLIENSEVISKIHIAFHAPDKSAVDEFYLHGIRHGYKCNGEPGLRERYAPNYYAAFLLDPDGNNIESVTYV